MKSLAKIELAAVWGVVSSVRFGVGVTVAFCTGLRPFRIVKNRGNGFFRPAKNEVSYAPVYVEGVRVESFDSFLVSRKTQDNLAEETRFAAGPVRATCQGETLQSVYVLDAIDDEVEQLLWEARMLDPPVTVRKSHAARLRLETVLGERTSKVVH